MVPGKPYSLLRKRAQRGPPGEPLYKREEIAERLGITMAELHGAMVSRPGLEPWHDPGHGPKLYRLSDAKAWWLAIKGTLR